MVFVASLIWSDNGSLPGGDDGDDDEKEDRGEKVDAWLLLLMLLLLAPCLMILLRIVLGKMGSPHPPPLHVSA